MAEHEWVLDDRCVHCDIRMMDAVAKDLMWCRCAPPVNDTGGEGTPSHAQQVAYLESMRKVIRYLQSDEWKRETAARDAWFNQLCEDIANDRVTLPVPADQMTMMHVDQMWQERKAGAPGFGKPDDADGRNSPTNAVQGTVHAAESIGHAIRQTARPVTLCGALWRYRP